MVCCLKINRFVHSRLEKVLIKVIKGTEYDLWVTRFILVYLTNNFEHPFKNLVGAAHQFRKACETIGNNWVHGISQWTKLFSSA